MRVNIDIDLGKLLVDVLTKNCPFTGQVVEKLWGKEYWIVNNDKYCMKLLEINPGYQCSLHYHKIKDETFIVVSGSVGLEVIEAVEDGSIEYYYDMMHGSECRIKPYDVHRFHVTSTNPALVIEISTTHSDEDVVRLEDSKKL